MIEFFKSFVITIMLSGGAQESVEICQGGKIITYTDTSMFEIVMPDTILVEKVTNRHFYPSLWFEGGLLDKSQEETRMFMRVSAQSDMKITFRREECIVE